MHLRYVPPPLLIRAVWIAVALTFAVLIGWLAWLAADNRDRLSASEDRLETSETVTAALAQQLRKMGVEPEVEVPAEDVAVLEGPPGSDGRDGRDGARGPIGPVGPRGQAGLRGPAGVDGADGADGTVGETGATGATGPAGPIGPVGPVGPPGPQGERGEQGPAGQQGPPGPTGSDGAPGPACPDGYVPRERTILTVEAPLGEPAVVCVPAS